MPEGLPPIEDLFRERALDDARGFTYYLSPDELLKMSLPLKPGGSQAGSVGAMISGGRKFNNLPALRILQNGKVLYHDGRHRAAEFKRLGYEKIPVRISWATKMVDAPAQLVSETGLYVMDAPWEAGPTDGPPPPRPEYASSTARSPEAPRLTPLGESQIKKHGFASPQDEIRALRAGTHPGAADLDEGKVFARWGGEAQSAIGDPYYVPVEGEVMAATRHFSEAEYALSKAPPGSVKAREAASKLATAKEKLSKLIGPTLKGGSKLLGPLGVGIGLHEAKRGLETGDVGRTIEGVTGGILHPMVGAAVREQWPSREVQAAEAGEETKADIIEGAPLPVTTIESDLKSQGEKHEQIAKMMEAGVPMHDIRKRVAAGALSTGE